MESHNAGTTESSIEKKKQVTCLVSSVNHVSLPTSVFILKILFFFVSLSQ